MTHADQKARPRKAGAPAQRSAAKESTPSTPERTPAQAQRLGGSYAMGPAVGLRSAVQAKLTVGRAGDRYEREADSVAERVATGQPSGDVSRIPPGGLQSQRAADGGGDGAGDSARDDNSGAAQTKCAACEAKQAQRQDEAGGDKEGGDDAQMKCAACEAREQGAQRQEDEAGDEAQEQAQRQEEEGGDEAQERAQREDDEGGEQVQEMAQREEEEGGDQVQEVAQRQDEGTEADEAEENQPDAEATDEDGAVRDCEGEEGEGAGGAESEGAEGAEGAEAEGAESEGASEEGEEGEAGAGGERDDLGCGGEGGEGGGEEAAAPEGGGGCGAGPEAGAEGEGASAGPEGGAPAPDTARPPAATGSVPGCGAEVEADREESSEAEGGGGEAAPAAETGGAPGSGECAQREGDDSDVTPVQEKEDEEKTQAHARTPARRRGLDTGTAARAIHARGAGEPLAPAVRQRVEGSLGVDLGGVRVHEDGNAQAAARALRAKAFTTRNHIFLAAGQSKHDVNLMAHETTHVLQQDAVARRKPEPGADAGAGGPAAASARAPVAADSTAVPNPPARAASSAQGPAETAPDAAVHEPTPPAAGGSAGPPAAPPRDGPPPPATPPGAAAGPPRAAAPGTAAKAAARPVRAPAASASATGGLSEPGIGPARAPVVSRSIAPPDPAAFTGEPSASMAALAALSPVRAPFAYRMFRNGVDGALDRRRASEHRHAPQGRYQVRSPNLPDGRTDQPQAATGPAPATSPSTPATAASPAKVTVASEDAGPAPAVDTTSQEREVETIDEKKPGAMEFLRAWLQRFFASVPTSDSNVNTDPGPVPTITYTKDSDPAQVETIADENRAKVTHGLDEADEERDDDFGEHEIEPDLEDGEEKIPVPAHVHEMGTGCDPEAEAEPLAFDPPHEAELAERVQATTGPRWTAETERLDASEQDRDRKIGDERGALAGRIADAHAEAYRQEDAAAGAARAEVDRLRASWGGENRGVQTRFDEASTSEAGLARGAITEHVGREDGLIAERHQADKQAAETEKARVEAQAKKEKEEAERKAKSERSGGLISRGVGWLKKKAKSALAWVAKKVKGWFDDLRAWVRKKFAEFKAWVNEKIEAARRWINEKLDGLRRRLHALVDKYLGEYPEIAKRFHRAIDTTIDAAQAAVNRAADRLKRAVNRLIDGVARAIDGALAVTEKVVVTALTVACDIVVIGANLTVAFVEGDLESMIVLVRELPDWPPLFGGLMSVVRAGFLGFLERMHAKPADMKKRFVEKLRGLLTSGKYYGGVFLGILNGLIVEGLFGTIKMIYEIITGIPQILTDIHDAIKRLASDVEAIAAIADQFDATKAEVKAFLDRPESAQEMIAMLKRSPQILVAMIDKALHEGREWAYRAGAKAADALFNWILTASNFDIGLAVGTFIGQVVFEVLLLVFTAGAGTAVKWGGKALQWLVKGLRMLTGGMRRGGGLILKGINLLREIVVAGLTAARKLGGVIRKVLAKIATLVDRVFDWFRRAFGRIKPRNRRRPLDPKEHAQWRAFVLEVSGLKARHPDGVTRAPLEREYRKIVGRFKVASMPVVTADDGFWELRAKKAGSLRPRLVARVAMDHASRWDEAAAAVRKRMLRVREDEREEGTLEAILQPLKRKWRFSALEAQPDADDLDFDVMGAMSRKKKIVQVPQNVGTSKKPLPLRYPKRASSAYDPLYIGPKVGAKGPFISQAVLKSARSSKPKKTAIAAGLPAASRHEWQAAGMPIETYLPHGSKQLPFGSRTTLGIMPEWRISRGKKLKLDPGDGTPGGGKVNRPLRLFGFSPATEHADGDHVVEIQLGGKDQIENLWPLDSVENQGAGGKLASMKFTVAKGKSVAMSQLKKLAKRGRAIWFKISSTK